MACTNTDCSVCGAFGGGGKGRCRIKTKAVSVKDLLNREIKNKKTNQTTTPRIVGAAVDGYTKKKTNRKAIRFTPRQPVCEGGVYCVTCLLHSKKKINMWKRVTVTLHDAHGRKVVPVCERCGKLQPKGKMWILSVSEDKPEVSSEETIDDSD